MITITIIVIITFAIAKTNLNFMIYTIMSTNTILLILTGIKYIVNYSTSIKIYTYMEQLNILALNTKKKISIPEFINHTGPVLATETLTIVICFTIWISIYKINTNDDM